MNVIDMLRSNQDQIEELFVEVEQTPTPTERLRLFQTIKRELFFYFHLEESALYPACEERPELRAFVEEAYGSHDAIRSEVIELGEIYEETEFNQKVEALIDHARENFQNRENRFLAKMETVFDEDELENLGDALIDAKERLTPAA